MNRCWLLAIRSEEFKIYYFPALEENIFFKNSQPRTEWEADWKTCDSAAAAAGRQASFRAREARAALPVRRCDARATATWQRRDCRSPPSQLDVVVVNFHPTMFIIYSCRILHSVDFVFFFLFFFLLKLVISRQRRQRWKWRGGSSYTRSLRYQSIGKLYIWHYICNVTTRNGLLLLRDTKKRGMHSLACFFHSC